MRNARVRRTTLWFVLAILLLAGVDGLALWSNQRNQESTRQGVETQGVLRTANDMSRAVTDVEVVSGALLQRPDGDLITRLTSDRVAIRNDLRSLHSLLAESPFRAALVDRVATLVETNDDWVAKVIETPGIEPETPNSAQARAARDDILATLRTIVDVERRSLLSSQGTAAASAAWSFWAILIGTLLSLTAATLVVLRLTQEADELRRARREIGATERLLEEIIQNSPQAISVRDLEGRFVLANAPFLKVLKKTREEAVGQLETDLVPKDAIKRTQDFGAEALRTNQSVEGLVEFLDGNLTRTFVVSRFPVRDVDGVVYGLGGVSTEVTELKQIQRAAERARNNAEAARATAIEATQIAEEANQAKTEFLSRVSHEFRTPMNSILGFAQLLAMREGEEPVSKEVEHILRAGRHLLRLIDEVLDISRIEAGDLALSLEAVSVQDVVSESIALVQPSAHDATVTLLDEASTLASAVFVTADRQRLRQILMNLLSNGIKYNVPGGNVAVRCFSDGEMVRLEVADQGIGVPPEMTGRLFVPFDRLDAAARLIEGTGLGLALSSRLATSMGGSIGYLPNSEGKGSVFWVELEAGGPPQPPDVGGHDVAPGPPQTVERTAGQRTILYVEDNLANVTLVEALLGQNASQKLIVAMQGRMGIELAREHLPDLILLDLHLPDMGGADVLVELRKVSALKSVPIIVVSADATEKQIERLLAMGAFAYLTKPFMLTEFFDKVEQALQR